MTRHQLKIQMEDLQVTKEVLEIRWKAYEDNRQKKLKEVLKERERIIANPDTYSIVTL